MPLGRTLSPYCLATVLFWLNACASTTEPRAVAEAADSNESSKSQTSDVVTGHEPDSTAEQVEATSASSDITRTSAATTSETQQSTKDADSAVSSHEDSTGPDETTTQQFECPPVDPMGGCHNEAECGPSGFCDPTAASSSTCGGAQFPDYCQADTDCESGFICETHRVDCREYLACTAACTDDSCGAGERCEAGRCVLLTCADDDGPTCAQDRRCNLTAPRADAYGCEPLPCAEGEYACSATQVCEPDSPQANPNGCRTLNCAEPGAVACTDGYQCNVTAAVPYCEPIHCTQPDGRACPANTRCDVDTTENAGCKPIPCAVAADCDCGVCIVGTCYLQPGHCQYFAP